LNKKIKKRKAVDPYNGIPVGQKAKKTRIKNEKNIQSFPQIQKS
jgi:hypothetical protein